MILWKNKEWYFLLATTAVIFGFNLYRVAGHQVVPSYDFVNYAQFVTPMKLHGTITKPHFLYPMLVAIVSMIDPDLSYTAIGAGIVLLFDLFCATVLWLFWKEIIPKSAPRMLAIVLTILTMLLAPVSIVTLFRHNLYLDYIAITTYHNPPLLVSRPVMLLHFFVFASVFARGTLSTRNTVLSFFLIIVTTLLKPNYATIMLPTAGIIAIWTAANKDFRMLRFVILGTVLPALLVLAWQYYFTFLNHYAADENAKVIVAPLLAYSIRSHALLPRFLLSILFPLGVLIWYWKKVIHDRWYIVGFLLFFFGVFESYMLAESGVRLYDGNFFFSAQIGSLLWFIVSMKIVIDDFFSKPRGLGWTSATRVLTGLFGLHIISGIVWYTCECISTGTYW